jgi:hypothetical protein
LKFIGFKKPFEEIAKAEVFKQIEREDKFVINDIYRLFPKKRLELLEEGVEIPEDEGLISDVKSLPYIGNKWGGKYIRAPEIFFKILEKGKDKLVRLGDIAEDYYGIKTGANEFFYLEPTGKPAPKGLLHVKNSAGWEGYIEEEFLKPVIKSPRELKTIIVREEDLKYKVFMCHKSKEQLKGTYALKYIEWGEKQGYHKRRTCASRPRWWDIIESKGNVLCLGILRERLFVLYNPSHFLFEHTLYGLVFPDKVSANYALEMNSTLIIFLLLMESRVAILGPVTMMVYEYLNLPLLNSKFLSFQNLHRKLLTRPILSIFEELGFQKCNQRNCNNPEHPYENVKPEEVSFDRIMPDRRELDKIVFEALGLTEEEQLEVYRAVLELVKNRLLKAKSK